METYLNHHKNLAGMKTSLFEGGASGLSRKENHLTRRSIIAAAKSEKSGSIAEEMPVPFQITSMRLTMIVDYRLRNIKAKQFP